MTFTPEQLAVFHEYYHILNRIAQRLIREGKAHIENGKLIIHKTQKNSLDKRRANTLKLDE
jgi:1,2-phenylacetyl-CoA epoxidase catalytic subunit